MQLKSDVQRQIAAVGLSLFVCIQCLSMLFCFVGIVILPLFSNIYLARVSGLYRLKQIHAIVAIYRQGNICLTSKIRPVFFSPPRLWVLFGKTSKPKI